MGDDQVAWAVTVTTVLSLLLSPVPIIGRVAAKSSATSLADTNVIIGTQIAGTRVRLNDGGRVHPQAVGSLPRTADSVASQPLGSKAPVSAVVATRFAVAASLVAA